MITYLIIDDEHIAHDIIKSYCDLLPNMRLMKDCYDGLEAFEYLNKNEVDLIFLDLNMPKLKGFDFLKTLKNPPKVIVTTAYKEFALEGYELNISDYLLKPFGFERFLKAINKTFINSNSQEVVPTKENGISKRIFLRSDKKYTQVEIDNILFIEASGNYTKVITKLETITVREKISSVLDVLPKEDFLQVHKSFAVAPKHIKSIEGNRIFIADHIVPVGKVYRTNIVQLLQ
ncbi:DNA-binding response regulator [Flagellimonas lutimaris]|uniref:DNA-binding response regulator n=1 Tax=Flagellimonas lutimaris TaxID=475082 RepID=A0A3A1N4H4_9FLAO|nr:LytTR family DNA-binding domain-containing protein [Allomuricauda lutimaris]RIV31638.1 DNA-binding response regulator [Allomuricauda lutimaris]